MEKTNPMRILDKAGVNYAVHDYSSTGMVSAMDVALVMCESPDEVFKTLVTKGKSDRYYTFVVPANKELDLKKAAASVDEKSVVMIHSKDLQSVTGYIHGGCSPLGMRKQLRTVIDRSAMEHERMYISGGKIGLQIELVPADLSKVLDFKSADIVR